MIYGLLRIQNSHDPFKVLDDVFYNKKINNFDTGNCYGRSENIFGEWISSRNINRNDIYIICKGGHHSYNGNQLVHRITQDNIVYDLNESFKRLKITYCDSFMFHRDDENTSPEKIYDICNYLLETNLCKKIGVSNWKTSRIEEVNTISKNRKGIDIIEESQIFLNYIKLSNIPYPNIHMINYMDYSWYLKHPEHKIQLYSIACFTGELDKNPNHQNKIFKHILDYICNITNETRQTILYVLLSNCKALNLDCIQGSISLNHILSQTKIDTIFSIIEEKIPNIIEFISCFLVGQPIGKPEINMTSFLMNGFVGPFSLQDIKEEQIDEIANWLINKKFDDYTQMKNHHEYNNDIKELCLNKTLNDIITTYIGDECICYNTEFFIRENNDNFQYTGNWHIDPYINIDNTYPHFTIQIGLTNNNENNSLSAILGSHLFDYQNNYNKIDKNNNFAPIIKFDEQNIDENLVYKLLNKKGYVYLFSNYLTHGNGLIKNNDKNIRVALTLRIISKKSLIGIKNNSHISKDIFTVGSSNNNSELVRSKILWQVLQHNYKSIFMGSQISLPITPYITSQNSSHIDEIIYKTYTWENSYIKFLDNFKMDAFGEGKYEVIDDNNIIAIFGGRIHNILFNENYTMFSSIREDDLQAVFGSIIH
jgi:predicted oxidoreductase/ectoine hydroxylase-related dioxygenase (phytanoyl-CoA dioxygenase family)